MTGPDHYRQAERLLEEAQLSAPDYYADQDAVPTLLAALAHAALAQAAATAIGGMLGEHRDWADAASG